MTEIIEALWELSWWDLAWIYHVMQWIALVRFWYVGEAAISIRALIWWRWER